MNATSDSKPTEAAAVEDAATEVELGEAQKGSVRGHPFRFLGITVFALLGLLAMAGVKSYRDLAAARDIENHLHRQIIETQARVEALSEHIDRIENDPATLERIAREELGMVREGDVVIVLPDEPMADSATERP